MFSRIYPGRDSQVIDGHSARREEALEEFVISERRWQVLQLQATGSSDPSLPLAAEGKRL